MTLPKAFPVDTTDESRLYRNNLDPAAASRVTPAFGGFRRHFPEIIKLFRADRGLRIDFSGFPPIFRLDAARYRNAIPRVSRLSAP